MPTQPPLFAPELQIIDLTPDDLNLGEVFTRRWVVETILDLVGYEAADDLSRRRIVDPACGEGAFVLPIVGRLIESAKEHGRPITDAVNAIRAFDLQRSHEAKKLVGWWRTNREPGNATDIKDAARVARLATWFAGDASWPSGSPQRLALLRDLERRFGPLETQQTRVGIGVATGADKVFITKDTAVAEEDRLIPLVMTRDIRSGSVDWGGTYLINPWARSSLPCRSMQGSARLASKHIRASM